VLSAVLPLAVSLQAEAGEEVAPAMAWLTDVPQAAAFQVPGQPSQLVRGPASLAHPLMTAPLDEESVAELPSRRSLLAGLLSLSAAPAYARPAPKTESLFDLEEKLAKEKEERYSAAGARAGAPPPVSDTMAEPTKLAKDRKAATAARETRDFERAVATAEKKAAAAQAKQTKDFERAVATAEKKAQRAQAREQRVQKELRKEEAALRKETAKVKADKKAPAQPVKAAAPKVPREPRKPLPERSVLNPPANAAKTKAPKRTARKTGKAKRAASRGDRSKGDGERPLAAAAALGISGVGAYALLTREDAPQEAETPTEESPPRRGFWRRIRGKGSERAADEGTEAPAEPNETEAAAEKSDAEKVAAEKAAAAKVAAEKAEAAKAAAEKAMVASMAAAESQVPEANAAPEPEKKKGILRRLVR